MLSSPGRRRSVPYRTWMGPGVLRPKPSNTDSPSCPVRGVAPTEAGNLSDPFGLDRIKLSKIREPPCSHGVSAPPARCPGEATYTGLASPGCAALSGFFNLSALSSSPGRPGLVSCR
jgi:hypothetical protein